ncbi:hypothetical protein [Xanthocytophaga flava]|uniref:hypothetical protein n=1 Tax=Xanthocytophaga flava TaxID=3048013 RepID=UPI0028D441C9|nr:hypothetical protein [Xanthocytophaga flavus]MDJ1473760.1 hypothetical protein [Xanthocytophaga flavus]
MERSHKENSKSHKVSKIESEIVTLIERPRICCFDLEAEAVAKLKKSGANIYDGTLGAKITIPNRSKREYHEISLNLSGFPLNLHEYDIIILDLNNFSTIDYEAKDHLSESQTGKSLYKLVSRYPETIFDPRPIVSDLLKQEFSKITNRPSLIIVFSARSYSVDYETIKVTESYSESLDIETYDIYSFYDNIPLADANYGKDVSICEMPDDFYSLLEKYKRNITYDQTFYHPKTLEGSKYIKDQNFFPLIRNINDEIVSYIQFHEKGNLILFPQIKDKSSFLLEFLSKIAPSIFPNLFPYSTSFAWKNETEYWLPKHAFFLKEKEDLQKEYEQKLEENRKKTEHNIAKYSFLHDILTESGEHLVNALIKYLKWLEFVDVQNYDETDTSSTVLEEDIQVILPNGLLIIECKGIGGTSTDSDCSQISKIKHRRCKQRGKFDVLALYIVNHQRYLPPLKRQNPPFTEHQIQDAINDERGLLSTWQLFKLYSDIENGIITKEEARKSILEFGLIEFKPSDLSFVYEPTEFFNNEQVCIVNIENITLNVNDELFIERDGQYTKAQILDIQDNGQSVPQATQGEFGLKLSEKIKKKSTLWKR